LNRVGVSAADVANLDSARMNHTVDQRVYFNLLMVGQSGDGKSCLINKILGEMQAESANNITGTTKEMSMYEVSQERMVQCFGQNDFDQIGVTLRLWDSRGLGDGDVQQVVKLLEQQQNELESDWSLASYNRHFDGLLLVNSLLNGTLVNEHKVAGTLIREVFTGNGKWNGVVWCGTKYDRVLEREKEQAKTACLGGKLQLMNRQLGATISHTCVTWVGDGGQEVESIDGLNDLIAILRVLLRQKGRTRASLLGPMKGWESIKLSLSASVGALMGLEPSEQLKMWKEKYESSTIQLALATKEQQTKRDALDLQLGKATAENTSMKGLRKFAAEREAEVKEKSKELRTLKVMRTGIKDLESKIASMEKEKPFYLSPKRGKCDLAIHRAKGRLLMQQQEMSNISWVERGGGESM